MPRTGPNEAGPKDAAPETGRAAGPSPRRARGRAPLAAGFALLPAVLLAAAGCAADAAPARPAAPLLPLAAAEERVLARAEQVLIARCLHRRGFAYVAHVPQDAAPARRFPYVIDDPAWARAHGFGTDRQRRIAALKAADPNERYFRGLPPRRRQAALAALHGPRPVGLSARVPGGGVATASDEGCTAEAQRGLYGDLPGWFTAKLTVANLTPLYVPRVREDPRYRRAEAAWGRCMAARGHRHATPDELRRALPRLVHGLPAGPARAEETRLAVAEADCARSSGLGATATALDREYGAGVRHRYRAAIVTELRLQRAALPTARRILSGEPA
ncbi:hypothetical protein [Streptomyces sp. NPDC012888]|uniref:hypothetical protein n=1 Tax=Streptomyces sp. NPDC012888 TaxID=3364855 RepID=UPI0036B75DB8